MFTVLADGSTLDLQTGSVSNIAGLRQLFSPCLLNTERLGLTSSTSSKVMDTSTYAHAHSRTHTGTHTRTL